MMTKLAEKGGAKTWYFPDGYLPEKTAGAMEAHEALMILNVHDRDAQIEIDFYFENMDAMKNIPVVVESERVRSFHLDIPEHIGGVRIPPLTQYALRLRSNLPVVVMLGRLDTTQSNMAYYTVSPYSE